MQRLVTAGTIAIAATLTSPCAGVLGATKDEALSWLQGRWTTQENCQGRMIEFQRTKYNWTYREKEPNQREKTYPAIAVADDDGTVTVQIDLRNGEMYQFANKFTNKDTFNATESITVGPDKGWTISRTYARCQWAGRRDPNP
jgi:hypothetical protein